MISYKRIFVCLFPLLLVCLIVGCGPTAQVTQLIEGNVSLDGVPLEGANITFHPKASDGTIAAGYSSSGGKFTVQTMHGVPGKGTTPGEYAVTVKKIESVPTGKKIKNEEGEMIDEMAEHEVTPKIYSSPDTTPITVEIVKGKNTVNLELSSSAK